jgi:hypothetical protein
MSDRPKVVTAYASVQADPFSGFYLNLQLATTREVSDHIADFMQGRRFSEKTGRGGVSEERVRYRWEASKDLDASRSNLATSMRFFREDVSAALTEIGMQLHDRATGDCHCYDRHNRGVPLAEHTTADCVLPLGWDDPF